MNEHETIPDIIAEMNRVEVCADGEPCLRDYARRFKAAIAREREASGNAAKQREALEKVRHLMPYFLQYMRLRWEDAGGGGYYKSINKMIDAALSAPPRNCDLSKVAEDPWRAWLDDKTNWNEDGNPKLEIHDWLLAPATEKEGGAK